jgi:ubiquinone/menaquinone biosynthesis C-methylase UbiE
MSEFEKILSYEEQSLPFYQRLLKLAGVQPGNVVLDVGCGACPLLALKERSFRLVGLDIDEWILNMAKTRIDNGTGEFLVRADALRLPFKDRSLDAVIACSFPFDATGFTTILPKEMARVLKPGGGLAIVEDVFAYTGRNIPVAGKLEELGLLVEIERNSGIVYAKKLKK